MTPQPRFQPGPNGSTDPHAHRHKTPPHPPTHAPPSAPTMTEQSAAPQPSVGRCGGHRPAASITTTSRCELPRPPTPSRRAFNTLRPLLCLQHPTAVSTKPCRCIYSMLLLCQRHISAVVPMSSPRETHPFRGASAEGLPDNKRAGRWGCRHKRSTSDADLQHRLPEHNRRTI